MLEYLDPPDDVEIIGICVNAKGAERAIATSAVATLGFPYSISPQFLERNQRQTPEEARSINWSRLGNWLTRVGRTWLHISRWRLEILMAMSGISTKW